MDDNTLGLWSSTRPATPRDLLFVLDLQRKYSNQVGYLPTPAIERYLTDNDISIAVDNDTPAGYLLGKPTLRWQPLLAPITQAAVAMDAQRRHHGLNLLADLAAAAAARGQVGLQACCAVGVEANEFWHAAGFVPICHMTPDNARSREIICWRLPLTKRIPLWFAQPPARAGWHAKIATTVRNPNRSKHAHAIATRYVTRATGTPEITP